MHFDNMCWMKSFCRHQLAFKLIKTHICPFSTAIPWFNKSPKGKSKDNVLPETAVTSDDTAREKRKSVSQKDYFADLERISSNKENVFIIQPKFKKLKKATDRFLMKHVDQRLAEASTLIDGVQNWSLVGSQTENVNVIHPKYFFGTGKLEELRRNFEFWESRDVSMLFVNTGELTAEQVICLESELSLKVCDRYRVVLELMKDRAHSKEARLQAQLAEIQYLRSHVIYGLYPPAAGDNAHRKRDGQQHMTGSAHSFFDRFKKRLQERELKFKKELQQIRAERASKRKSRKNRVPLIALVGYTNSGKTTLVQTLSHDANRLTPENKLFSTLDTTVHTGFLFSHLEVMFVDTIGFLSDLPHNLIGSFECVLDDIKDADLIVHVWDALHPEAELQKQVLLDVLDRLDLPDHLANNIVEVHNKADLSEGTSEYGACGDDTFIVSATEGHGIEELVRCMEEKVLSNTDRTRHVINFNQEKLEGDQLTWLYQHGTVVESITQVDGSLDVHVILDLPSRGKFQATFQETLL